MGGFTMHWLSASELPDDRLVHMTWETERGLVRVKLWVAEKHIDPALTNDLDELVSHLANSEVYEFRPDLLDQPEEFTTEYERIDPEFLPMRTFGMRMEGGHVLFVVRRDLITPEAIRELNEYVLPDDNSAFRTVARVRASQPEPPSGNSCILDAYPDL